MLIREQSIKLTCLLQLNAAITILPTALVRFDSMLSTAKLDSLFSVIVDRKYFIPSVLGAECFSFCAVLFK